MARWNSFQKDLLIISVLAVLHLVFTAIFPLKGMPALADATLTRQFALFTFESAETGETVTYIPILTGFYVLLTIGLILRKPRSQTLIYGLGLVLVTKFSFLSQLAELEGGSVAELEATGLLSITVRASGELVAQDLAGYVLLALFLIKLAIVTHTAYVKRKRTRSKRNVSIESKNEVPS